MCSAAIACGNTPRVSGYALMRIRPPLISSSALAIHGRYLICSDVTESDKDRTNDINEGDIVLNAVSNAPCAYSKAYY
jgi:hypothetical protein